VGGCARNKRNQGCGERDAEARVSKVWAREHHHAVRFPLAGLGALKLR